ncbi:MAG TPA: DHA2 family efflux MFS transporter permease subunit [Candidatus Baltobacteraceae bacterium]|jgi:DHA2 family multidrug resistance protein|nr:DHA2 family efflux MFS transporter permease subunit [Candidatus Baltobacteraceae bacterium]
MNPNSLSSQRSVVESGGRLVLIVVAVMLATLLQTLDTTIVNVALPIIQGNLGATIDEGAWVVTGYIISAVIVIPLTPWLQMRFGRRQYYGTAVVGFTIASMLCGISTSIDQLIIWRILQGLFGGGLIATAQATLSDTFPREKLGTSQALFAMGAIVGPTIGPILGGWLTDNFTWNEIFFINVIPGTIAAFIIFTQLRNPTDPRPIPVDTMGVALLATGLGSLQYVLDEGQRNDWFNSELICTCMATAVVGLISFALWEIWGTCRPIVDLRALTNRSISAGACMGFAIGASLLGSIVLLPQYVQGVLGYTATLSGQLILLRAVVIALFTPLMARLASSGRFDTRILLGVGFLLLAVSSGWQALVTTSFSPFWALAPPMLISGFALALLFVPLSVAVLSSIPPAMIPKASAFTNLSLQLGGSFSTAALVSLLANRSAFHQDGIAATIKHTNIALNIALAHVPLARIYSLVVKQAMTQAYADASMVLAIISLVLTPLVFVLRRPRRMTGVAISAE